MDGAICKAIASLSYLTGEDFHGYRSEIWNVVATAINEGNAALLAEIEELKARAEAAERQRDDALAWAEKASRFIEDVSEEVVAYGHFNAGALTETAKKAKSFLSLPLPGSAERMKKEVRREAFREVLEILTPMIGHPVYDDLQKGIDAIRAACPEKEPCEVCGELTNGCRTVCPEKGGER